MKETNLHTKTIINKAWNPTDGRFDYSFTFAFHTRAEYLEFRRCWKASYAALAQAIRGLKATIKSRMRLREYAGNEQSEACTQAAEATTQLALLKAAKVEAARQYLAETQLLK